MNSSIIDDDVNKVLTAKRVPKVQSVVYDCVHNNIVNFQDKLFTYRPKNPIWLLPDKCTELSMSKLTKTNTPNDIYKQQHLSFLSQHNDWLLLYTDASKNNWTTAYAVVDNYKNILCLKYLRCASSIFTAEAAGILFAVEYAISIKRKTVIFSDSLSAIKSINNLSNTSWTSISKIRDLLITNKNKIKLCWIPGHVGISGNEHADKAAKFACTAPIIADSLIEKNDLKNHIIIELNEIKLRNQHNFHHRHYSATNPEYIIPCYPTNIDKKKIRIFSRLRMGHCITTHQHLINKDKDNNCPNCGDTASIEHILESCRKLVNLQMNTLNNAGMSLLKTTNEENINKIFNFISQSKVII
ncbi:uncharacterized protein LOC142235729 [Haematobia irritans]|uniref:uncharacterized protein LOC142235729 n=1 Tax=Haematobia irritans TaxID=7368 RepID=UPI003F50035A